MSAFFVSSGFGQTDGFVERNQFKVDFLTPGLANEFGISKRSTLRAEVATFFGFNLIPTSECSCNFAIFPMFDGQYRWYHNFQGRRTKGKNVEGNSADFFGFQAIYVSPNPLLGKLRPSLLDIAFFGNISGFEILFFGPTYGFQRTFSSGLNVGIQFSVGYVILNQENANNETRNSYHGVGPNLSLGVGWVIVKNKKQ